jgi:hypothetical protein
MANTATNIAKIDFCGKSVEDKKVIMTEFKDEFEVYNEYPEEDEDDDFKEIEFGSKWSEPIDWLQEWCDKHKINICGVCYEWGNNYTSHYEINFQSEIPDSRIVESHSDQMIDIMNQEPHG